MKNCNIERIIIYRLGSLGDTVVALPALHLVARVFPNAKRYLLGTSPSNVKACDSKAVLDGTGLLDDYIAYPVGLRDPKQLLLLRKQIKEIRPDVLIYLAAVRNSFKVYRDALFFRLCGIKKMIGVPYTADLQKNRWLSNQGYYEHEGVRLARCLAKLGHAHVTTPENWGLHLSFQEVLRAQEVLNCSKASNNIIACSPGAKVDAKHWGINNWQKLMKQLHFHFDNYRMVFIGAKDEYAECEKVGNYWPGEKSNFCGKLTPRESAAVLKKATFFICHDSGPMHLAASVETPCVAIFSARNKPAVWFPYGDRHKVLYHETECYGCGLEICIAEGAKCIKSITVEEVIGAALSISQHG